MVRDLSTIRSRAIPRAEAIPAVYVTVAVFAVVFPILVYNTAPGISFHDSGEFSLALASVGIPHSPGAPAWAIFSLLFRCLTCGVEAARSANLFSAFCGTLTAAFSSAFVFRHFSDRSNAVRWLAATITALSIICTGSFLEQSLIAEQYTLMTATIAAILLTIQTNESNPRPRWFYLMGVLWGLDMANHPSQVILGFLFVLPVIQKRKEVSLAQSIPLGLLGIATGLSVFLYVPIRAAAHPIMNWGHADNWKQFLWNIKREQWDTRPMNTAPTGFIKAWFNSYNLLGEMGVISTILSVSGFILGFRRAPRPMSWLILAIVPYAIIMLLGHLRQKGMDLMYIKIYGVRDWHIPIYMGLSMLAAMGAIWLLDARRKCTEKVRIGTLSTIAIGLAGYFPYQMSHETMRNYVAPLNFAKGYFAGLPNNAILAAYCDDAAHILGYERYANNMSSGVYFTFGMPQNGLNGTNSSAWTLDMKKEFMQKRIQDPAQNPLSLPYIMPDQEVADRPLFTEFTGGDCTWLADYCLPHGWVVQLLERKTSDEEVHAADKAFNAQHPELFVGPTGPQHRLTREAMSYVHTRRAFFYMQRKMWAESKSALELAMAWEPENPQIIFAYGSTLEELKDYAGAEKAYLSCIDITPDFVSPRHNLAILYAYAKRPDLAKKYIDEEVELSKNAPDDLRLRDTLYQKLGLRK